MRPGRHFALALALTGPLLGAAPAAAEDPPPTMLPPAVRDVEIEEHLGQALPTDLRFRDPRGAPVQLADYFEDGKPVILVLAYLRCPMLCDLVLGSLSSGLKQLGWAPGDRYRLLTVSIDPRDTPAAAALKQTQLLQSMGHPEATPAWPFLVGDQAAIARLAERVGFRYTYDPRTDQYTHPAVAIVLTPSGRISRYLYGASFPPRDLRLGLVEAGQGKVGGIVDRVLLTCFRFDPSTRRYGLYVLGVMKGGAALLLLTLVITLGLLWRRERTSRRTP